MDITKYLLCYTGIHITQTQYTQYTLQYSIISKFFLLSLTLDSALSEMTVLKLALLCQFVILYFDFCTVCTVHNRLYSLQYAKYAFCFLASELNDF